MDFFSFRWRGQRTCRYKNNMNALKRLHASLLLLLSFLFLMVLMISCNPLPRSEGASLKDYEEALKQAKTTKGLALLDFYADY